MVSQYKNPSQAAAAYIGTGSFGLTYEGKKCSDGAATSGKNMTPLFHDKRYAQLVVDLMNTGTSFSGLVMFSLKSYTQLIQKGQDDMIECELSFWTLHLDPIFSLLLAAVPSYFFGKYFTENIFAQKPLVTTAPCPECGSLMTVYFGDLLSVQTDGIIGAPTPPQDEVMCKCGNCKSDLKADRTRMIIETLPNPAKVAA